MSLKAWVWIGVTVGSSAGGYLPMLWGESVFSVTSLLLGFVGGILGIWAGYKLHQRF